MATSGGSAPPAYEPPRTGATSASRLSSASTSRWTSCSLEAFCAASICVSNIIANSALRVRERPADSAAATRCVSTCSESRRTCSAVVPMLLEICTSCGSSDATVLVSLVSRVMSCAANSDWSVTRSLPLARCSRIHAAASLYDASAAVFFADAASMSISLHKQNSALHDVVFAVLHNRALLSHASAHANRLFFRSSEITQLGASKVLRLLSPVAAAGSSR